MLLGDCLKIMPALGEVDHVVSDPPYEDEMHATFSEGRIRAKSGKPVHRQQIQFEGINATRDEASKLMAAASRGWILVFGIPEGTVRWRDSLQAAGAGWDTTCAWIKPDAIPRYNGDGAARGFECIFTAWAGKGRRRWNGGGKKGVFVHCVNGRASEGDHPTEKPLPLMKELVSLYSNPGDLILDPYAGSGSTGVACLELGRRFLGIERHKPFFDDACRRLRLATRQPNLFDAPKKPVQTDWLRGITAPAGATKGDRR